MYQLEFRVLLLVEVSQILAPSRTSFSPTKAGDKANGAAASVANARQGK